MTGLKMKQAPHIARSLRSNISSCAKSFSNMMQVFLRYYHSVDIRRTFQLLIAPPTLLRFLNGYDLAMKAKDLYNAATISDSHRPYHPVQSYYK